MSLLLVYVGTGVTLGPMASTPRHTNYDLVKVGGAGGCSSADHHGPLIQLGVVGWGGGGVGVHRLVRHRPGRYPLPGLAS